MEYHGSCAYDAFTLTDSGDGSSVSMCGSDVAGYDYVSTGNVVTVAFTTDYSVTYAGWLLFFEAVEDPGSIARGNMTCTKTEGFMK